MSAEETLKKNPQSDALTENFNVPTGKTITIGAGGTLVIASGATIQALEGSTLIGLGSGEGGGLSNVASTISGATLTMAGTLTTGRTITWRDLAGTVALTSDLSSYQPSDSDLTAIAALTTTTYGRSLLTGADAAEVRTLLGLGTAALLNVTASEGSGSLLSLASHTHNLGGGNITGTLPITKGGTGLVDTPTNGQLLIGNTATNAWARATLTGGNGITITNGNASISIAVNLGTLSGTVPVANGGTGITSFGSGVATWLGTPSSANLATAVTGETGSGALVFGTSPTLTTPTISGVVSLQDDVRQTFNPGSANAGLNVGVLAGDPSSPTNGDLWYDSTANELTARINGANVALGSGGGGGGLTNIASSISGATLTMAGTLSTGRTITWRDLAGTAALTSDLVDPDIGDATGMSLTLSGGAARLNANYVVVGDLVSVHSVFGLNVGGDLGIGFSADGTWFGAPDTLFRRDAAGVMGLRNGTNAQEFRVYETFTDSSNYECLSFSAGLGVNLIFPEAAGTGSASRVEYHTTSTGVRLMSGSGSPEAAISAPVGSIYQRTDGGSGTAFYVKESGTGNTGWVSDGARLANANKVELTIPISDETTDVAAVTSKLTFRMAHAMTLTEVRLSSTTAPTGSTLIVDINESGSTILSTKLSLDAGETTSLTAATAAVISDTSLADNAVITFDIDQVGSSVAGTGLKVILIGTR